MIHVDHCHRALSGAELCCFAPYTSVEHQYVRYARQFFCAHFPKSTRGTAGYWVLHGPILLEEQESRSGTSTHA